MVGLLYASKRNKFIFWILGLGWIASFLAITPGLIFRPHYYILWLPFLSLSAGYGIAQFGRWYLLALPIVLLPLAFGRQIFFEKNPEEVCRYLYPHNGFVESREVSGYLSKLVRPGEKIVVMGSEPQIYFYTKCSTATPYLYLYPLMEPQPYALEMQREFMEGLETMLPEYLVHVRVPTSWLVHPQSEKLIFDWIPVFLEKKYLKMEKFPVGDQGREIVVYRQKH
jgi:hypothetical protein